MAVTVPGCDNSYEVGEIQEAIADALDSNLPFANLRGGCSVSLEVLFDTLDARKDRDGGGVQQLPAPPLLASRATRKRKRRHDADGGGIHYDSNPSRISSDADGATLRITGAFDKRKWKTVQNRGGGACFQLTLAQWLGRRYGQKEIKHIALDTNELVIEKLKQVFPALAADSSLLSQWMQNSKEWEIGDAPWMDEDAWCDVACAFNITVCMFTDSQFLGADTNHKWHVSRPTTCNRVDPGSTEADATEARTRSWINAGHEFDINPDDMPCCLFVMYTQTKDYGHYELLLPRFPIPGRCYWGPTRSPAINPENRECQPARRGRLSWDRSSTQEITDFGKSWLGLGSD